jgi:hypothetical protein
MRLGFRKQDTHNDNSSWRRIKHDFLHHFHSPRLDLLVWVLVTKLAPTYYRKLDALFVDTGRNREPSSWRKAFKREWRKLESRTVAEPVNDAYSPNVEQWVCTCPAFVVSRFLICKHLVHLAQRVPATFFIEAQRRRTCPFWQHRDLQPLLDENDMDSEFPSSSSDFRGSDDLDLSLDGSDGSGTVDDEVPYENDDDDLIHPYERHESDIPFEEELNNDIELIRKFAAGLEYQLRFRDHRLLDVLHKEGRSFFRMAKNCLDLERKENTNIGPKKATWQLGTAMFYRPRPRLSEAYT